MRCNLASGPPLYAAENTLALYEQGLIDEDAWRTFLANNLDLYRLPGGRQLLDVRSGPLSARFREVVLTTIGDHAPPDA
jgi:hypothetical protein